MELGFPDMSMVINIIFFLLVALFLIFAAKMIMERSEPKFVISVAFIPASLHGLSRKGFEGILKFIIMALVCFAVLIALFFLFSGQAQAMAGSIGSGLLDWVPFL